jgi:two-component system nitrogen regulation sensor histidine kinase GlnL
MASIEKSILTSFRAGIVAIGQDGTVAYVNPIGAKILEGCPLREGENIHPRAGENSFFRVLSEAITMNYLPTRVEVELPGKDGDRQYLGFTLSDLKDSADRRVGVCAFFKDLTQVEMAEENEDLKQRLLLLGQMAAGLAHEIRNPIAGIGVHCGILKNHLAQNEKLLSSVSMMEGEISRVEYIIRECLNFVRPAELGIKAVRIDQVVEGIVDRLRAVHADMEFTVSKVSGQELVAEVDPGLFEQAISNILSNAAEACGGKGRIDVSFGISRHFSDLLRLGRRVEPLVHGHSGKEEEFIRITIRDNGPGIPPEIQDKIFVPFFTTKKTGTGIGLPMAQKIVHAHGGVMDLKSEPGKGTDFVIKIPMRQTSGG